VPDLYSPGAYPFDFAANRLPPPWKRTLPIGLDVEVCSFDALQRAWQRAREPYQREHVMPFIYEGIAFAETTPPPGPGWYIQQGTSQRGFRVALLNHSPNYGAQRWTVDTPADLEFVRQVFARLDSQAGFTWQDVQDLLEREPELSLINADVKHKSAFDVDEQHQGH
jgi:spore coat polysaccharide biosynthesis protein SpsF